MAVLSDPISDFLTRFKNACMAERESFSAPHSKLKTEVARILADEGYLWGYEVKTDGKFPEVQCKVKYLNDRPVLTGIKKISKPGLRQYVSADAIPVVLNGLGICIISTSRGIMSGHEAKRQKLGGEVLAHVW
jgi:small subunit ribosomal protein S8